MADGESGMSAAFVCEICQTEPLWRLDRHGDAVVSWACAEHLSPVAERMQRDWEITELSVRLIIKMREWNELAANLDAIAKDASS